MESPSTLAIAHRLIEPKWTEDQSRFVSLVMDNMRDAVVASNEQYLLVAWNAAAEAMYGWKAEEVLGRNGLEVCQTRFAEADKEKMLRAIAESGGYRGEATQVRKGGERFAVEVNSLVLRNQEGQIVGYVSINCDITERKHAEAEFTSLAKFPSENPSPVLRLNREGVILYANAASGSLLRDWGSGIGGRVPLFWQEQIVDALTQQKNKVVDFACGEIIYSANIVPVPEAGYVNLYLTDISQRKQAESHTQKLNRLYNTLSQINQAIVFNDQQDRLFQEICRVAIEFGKYRMAWIGLIDETTFEVKPVAVAGEDDGYLADASIQYSDGELGQGPTGVAIREDRCVVCPDIATNPLMRTWRDRALKRGYRSSAAVSLRRQGRVVGALTVYDGEPMTFDDEQMGLLAEIGGDISYALDKLDILAENARTENALREIGNNLNTLIENTDGSIWAVDSQYNLIVGNAEFHRRTGATLGRNLQKGENVLVSTFPSKINAEWQSHYDRALRGESFRFETQTRLREIPRHVEYLFSPIRDAGGEIHGVTVYGHDITDHKLAEDKLRESEESFRTVADFAYDWEYWLGEDYRLVYISPSCERITGYRREDFENDPSLLQKIVHPDDRLKYEAHITEEFDNQEPISLDFRVVTADGRERWVAHTCQRVFAEDGRPRGRRVSNRDITDRKQAEQALIQASERLALAQRAAKAGIWDWDMTTGQLIWSPEFFELFGLDQAKDAPTFDTWRRVLHPEDLKSAETRINESIRDHTALFNEYRIVLPTGDARWIEAMGDTTYDERGQAVRMSGICIDITERRLAEDTLRQSEARFTAIFNSSPVAIALTSMSDNALLDVNPAWQELTGYKRGESIGRTPTELNLWVEPLERERLVQTVMKAGRVQGFEFLLRHKSGEIASLLMSAEMITLAGKPYLITSALDITKRKRIEEALVELNQTLEERIKERSAQARDLYENAPAGYHSLDADGCFLEINQTALNWLGRSRADMLGKSISNIFTEKSDRVFKENFPLFKANGKISDLELEIIRHDGTTLPVMINATAIYDADGNYLSSRSTLVDIAERKEAEETLRFANSELERAMRLKDEFLASMSHELRTPLTGVLGLAEILQMGVYGELNQKQMGAIKTIDDSGHHLLELINDILDLAKIEAGKLELDFSHFSILDVCRASLQLTKGMAGKKHQVVRFTPPSEPILAYADSRRVKQILVNLLSNAIKFTPERGELGLEVCTNRESETLQLIVWDKGVGIKEESLPRLFKPFTQIDGRLSREYAGTGLGLSMVQRLVALHGGDIQVESMFGEGSRFIVTLPWSPDSSIPVQIASLENGMTGADLISRSLSPDLPLLAVVDDNEATLQMIADFFELLDFRVVKLNSGRGLIEKIASLRPDLILMDIQMPGMNGLEVIHWVRAHEDPLVAAVPVIAVTALAMPDDRTRCLLAGADEYMSKPVKFQELHILINKLIDARRKSIPN
jgi:PAS domain S-box-containing protein